MVTPKVNALAEELVSIATKQLATSYNFKLPRLLQIRKYRDLYNGKVPKLLRIRFNVPIPIFAGMIDTLQADLDDVPILKFKETDPADWKSIQKANAALDKEAQSDMPDKSWNYAFRMSRQENVMTGRGFLKYTTSSDGGYSSRLTAPVFENMFWEPKGGGKLDKHIFVGEGNIWKNKTVVESEKGGMYDARQVDKLLALSQGTEYKQSQFWENLDYANRFLSLNLAAEANNYIGEPMYNFVEWVLTHKGIKWYLLFEAYSGTWIRLEKLTDIHSDGLIPWMSYASHEDQVNFASKGFADDLYPIAYTMTEFINEDLENRKRRASHARAYDPKMFPNLAQLDEAQMGRDRLVEVNTQNGTRRIQDGVYEFTTPEITGTLDLVRFMEDLSGRNLGVTDLQQGAAQDASKKVGVAYTEMAQVSKRLSFMSQPFIEVAQQLGMRFFGGLKDYMKTPMAVKLLGENGYQIEMLRRIDLNLKDGFEVTCSSQMKENKINQLQQDKKMESLMIVRDKPSLNKGINTKMADEEVLRNGGWSEAQIALLLDPNTSADKETLAETSSAIQELMMGRVPMKNWNANLYFVNKLLNFVQTHRGDPSVKKNYDKFISYIEQHLPLAQENEQRLAKQRAQKQLALAQQVPGQEQQIAPVPNQIPGQQTPITA